jgi:GT2 family glycosyltransferase/tetratricopeptide (TPR) repeat protein/SAM-dependent methyltransferase
MARRIAVIYNDRARPETTGGYCLQAARAIADAIHIYPDEADRVRPGEFDLFVRVDDGLDTPIPRALRPLVWWAIDTHLDFDRCLAQAAAADLTFAAQRPGAAALARAGVANARWLPLACDPAVHRRHDVPKAHDVCFVGNVPPGPRADLLGLICRRCPGHFVGQAYFDDMARAYSAARIVFNRSVRDDLNMRVFEALACGSLLLTNDLPDSGQADLFRDGVHLATYRDPDELLDKLAFYLARPEPRSRVEEAGRQAVTERHTYRHRMETILTAAEALPRSVPVAAGPAGGGVSGPAPGYFDHARPELLALIPPVARDVVDVGCGAGRLGEALKARQPVHVVGVEQDPRAAAAARGRLDLVVEGDAEAVAWPFPGGTFDAVVCGDVLEHLRNPLTFLRKARTWLRPGGLLLASLPNVRHHSVVRGLLDGNWTYEPAGLLDHTHLRFFTRREVEKLFHRAGFGPAALSPVPGPGYAEWDRAGRPGEVRVGALRIGPMSAAEAEEFYAYQWLVTAGPAATPDRGLTSVIILTHNQLAHTRGCVDSIRLLTDEPYELVFVDNGSTDGTPDYLRALAAADDRVKVVLNPDNRGFPAGANQGIVASAGAQVLLLNNDTVVTTGWLGRLLDALHSAPDVGLAGPCSNRVSGGQQVEVTYDDPSGLDGFAWEWGKAHAGVTEETDRLVGFCLLARRAVIDRVGLLDERFGVGNFEDDDYCLRAHRAGYRAVIARGAFVHHDGGVTFAASGVDYAALLRRNEALFRAKWGTPDATPAGPQAPRGVSAAVTTLSAPGVTVSGCLIVRDNAGTIRPCLESLRPWVDELVVVDTGSADETPRIAAALGARVFHFPWCDDFSAARNESVRHARGEWVFWMDSDDTIDAANGRGLRELAGGLHPDNVLGYVVRVHCPGPGGAGGDDLTVVDHVKLFRNRPGLRFEGRIHEQILPAVRRAGGEVGWTDLFVVHSGYDHSPEGQERKKERDLRLLGLELAAQPGHPFTLFNLGMTYADIGRYADAVPHLEGSLRQSAAGESHRRKAYALLAHCHARLGRPGDAEAECERGLAEFPGDAELEFRRGMLLHGAGRLREAAEAYRRVLSEDRGRYFTSVDRGIRGYKARQNLAAVCSDSGDWAGAEAEWRAVTAEVPRYRPGWRGLGEALFRQGKLTESNDLAGRLVADPSLRVEGLLLAGRVADGRGQGGEARRAWEAAAAADPTDPEPCRQLGRLYFEGRNDPAAERVLRSLLTRAPDDAAAHHNLGAVLLRLGRAEAAVGAFRRSLDLRPESLETGVCLGYALRAAGDERGAVEVWQGVLARAPGHLEAAAAIAEAHAKRPSSR